MAHLDPLTQMLYIDTRANLPDDLLMVADKTSMANSLEVRVPFLDHRLVQFIESLPPGLKLRGLTGKYLHKKAMTKWLPRGRRLSEEEGIRASGLRLVAAVDEAADRRLPAWQPSRRSGATSTRSTCASCVRRHQNGTENYMRQIYLLLSLELWHRTYFTR